MTLNKGDSLKQLLHSPSPVQVPLCAVRTSPLRMESSSTSSSSTAFVVFSPLPIDLPNESYHQSPRKVEEIGYIFPIGKASNHSDRGTMPRGSNHSMEISTRRKTPLSPQSTDIDLEDSFTVASEEGAWWQSQLDDFSLRPEKERGVEPFQRVLRKRHLISLNKTEPDEDHKSKEVRSSDQRKIASAPSNIPRKVVLAPSIRDGKEGRSGKGRDKAGALPSVKARSSVQHTQCHTNGQSRPSGLIRIKKGHVKIVAVSSPYTQEVKVQKQGQVFCANTEKEGIGLEGKPEPASRRQLSTARSTRRSSRSIGSSPRNSGRLQRRRIARTAEIACDSQNETCNTRAGRCCA